MTIAAALRTRDGLLVTSDRRRFETDGTHKDDCDKTFGLTNGFMAAQAGLLEVGGQRVSTLLSELSQPGQTLADFVEVVRSSLLAKLNGTEHREAVDLLIAGVVKGDTRTEVYSLRFERKDGGEYAVTMNEHPLHACVGNDAAKKSMNGALERLARSGIPQSVKAARLSVEAEMRAAIGASGVEEASTSEPKAKACGGEPCFQTRRR